MLKPTAYLTISLSADGASTAIASAIKRAFSYIAPTKIVLNETLKAPQGENSLGLDVRIPQHPYLCDNSAEGQQTWESVVLPWLCIKLDTLFGTVREFNNETRQSFVAKVNYQRFDLVLEGREIRFELEPNDSFDSAKETLEDIRAWFVAHAAQAERVSHIFVPAHQTKAHKKFSVVFASPKDV